MIATQFALLLCQIFFFHFIMFEKQLWKFWMSFLSTVTLSKAGFGGNPFASWAGVQIQNPGTLRCRSDSDSIRRIRMLSAQVEASMHWQSEGDYYASSIPSSARQRRKDTNLLSSNWKKLLVAQRAITWFFSKEGKSKKYDCVIVRGFFNVSTASYCFPDLRTANWKTTAIFMQALLWT